MSVRQALNGRGYKVLVDSSAFSEWWELAATSGLWKSAAEDSPDILNDHLRGPDTNARVYIAYLGGEPVGVGYVYPEHFSTATGHARVGVVPSARGKGAGKALTHQIIATSASLGVTRLFAQHRVPDVIDKPASALAAGTGFLLEGVSAEQSLDLASLKEAAVQAPCGEIVSWEGACPEELVAQYAPLVASGFGSKRVGSDEVVVAYRRAEAQAAALGKTMFVSVALSGNGELIGHSRISVKKSDPVEATQGVTLVRPEYRRQGWASGLKSSNTALLRSRSPASKYLVTVNRTTNEPILRLNESLGFVKRASLYQYVFGAARDADAD
ncbi:GNAT family N-acetyltransferase [Curtobacterium sp. MCLR17_032]|uniref:GNAT family N-acetyltransferase n=1 Tax=Curtobacterium sp. MCLR17_032 TaxID=2175650 RepID=UPI000DA7355B|nr:GNAT family N-acetyltransferase [Curtobacterium sp. MCLR17_032]WIE61436.1 GNAT family N-acetyltransferase [Curtobacterium sp. MCLR17_032]